MGNNNSSVWILILFIAVIYLAFIHKQTYEGYTAEEWFDEYAEAEQYETLYHVYSDALDQANNNIDEAK